MRRAAALAACGLLALALAVAGACKPSSLTPFTDWREEQTGTSGVNGQWFGPADAGGPQGSIEFTIASNRIADIRLHHSPGECGRLFFSTTTTATVEGDTFHVDMTLETQGRVVIDGTFTSSTACTGTYFFEGIRVTGVCPTSSTGTFTATKTP